MKCPSLLLLLGINLEIAVKKVWATCCTTKVVNSGTGDARDGVYILNTTLPNLPVFCQDQCVYTKNGTNPQDLYCFGDGDLDSECYAPQAEITPPQGLPDNGGDNN